jgi:hypothetical protein
MFYYLDTLLGLLQVCILLEREISLLSELLRTLFKAGNSARTDQEEE